MFTVKGKTHLALIQYYDVIRKNLAKKGSHVHPPRLLVLGVSLRELRLHAALSLNISGGPANDKLHFDEF